MEAFTPDQLSFVAAIAFGAFMLGRVSAGRGRNNDPVAELHIQQAAEQLFSGLPSGMRDEIDAQIASGRTIEAIKTLRAATGAGLRDAKRAVDWRKGTLAHR